MAKLVFKKPNEDRLYLLKKYRYKKVTLFVSITLNVLFIIHTLFNNFILGRF